MDEVWAPVISILVPLLGLAAPSGFSGQETAFHDVSKQALATYIPFAPLKTSLVGKWGVFDTMVANPA